MFDMEFYTKDHQHHGPIVAERAPLFVIDCTNYGYAHLLDLPTQEQVDAYYNQDKFYNTHSPPDWLQREAAEHKAGLWTPYYKWEARHFPVDGTIVDIGCGTGWFSYIVRNTTGRFSYGIEPSDSARELAKQHGIHLIYSDTEGIRPLNDRSSIRMRLVLEHLLDPKAMLRQCHQWAGKGGILEIVVPNELNPLQNIVRKQYGSDWFVQAPHINYFTKQSIVNILNDTGWQIVDIGATFPTELWWLAGYRYIGNDKLGHDLHLRRLKFEYYAGKYAFNLYRKLYQWFGIGRELIVFAKH